MLPRLLADAAEDPEEEEAAGDAGRAPAPPLLVRRAARSMPLPLRPPPPPLLPPFLPLLLLLVLWQPLPLPPPCPAPRPALGFGPPHLGIGALGVLAEAEVSSYAWLAMDGANRGRGGRAGAEIWEASPVPGPQRLPRPP